jgi:hypothetical protein
MKAIPGQKKFFNKMWSTVSKALRDKKKYPYLGIMRFQGMFVCPHRPYRYLQYYFAFYVPTKSHISKTNTDLTVEVGDGYSIVDFEAFEERLHKKLAQINEAWGVEALLPLNEAWGTTTLI